MKKKLLSFNPLVVLLVVVVFASGYLFSRVQMLESQLSGGSKVVDSAGKHDAQQPSDQKPAEVDKVTKDDHIRGDLKKAKIALIEYSDLECPFCKRFHPTAQQAVDEYGDEIVWVYRQFPLSQLHSKAPKEAEAAECATELGGNDGFWAFIDKVFEITPANNGLEPEKLPEIAGQIGLNKGKFQKCLDSGKYADKVQSQYQSGIKAGVNGTPGNILMDLKTGKTQLIPGAVPFDTLKQAIDGML
ncbi:MAG: DsbA family protein [Candidatus Paceibacterota bacterium]